MANTQVQALLSEALRHHGAGRLDQAALLYQQALALDPGNGDALNLLGMLAMQAGEQQGGIELLRRAVAADGRQAVFHFNLGVALQTVGSLDEAVASYRRALVLRPGDAQSCGNLGSALAMLGRLDEAETALRKSLALAPGDPVILDNLGTVTFNLGRKNEAEAHYRQALALQPGHADALVHLGNLLRDRNDLTGAADCLRQALAQEPSRIDALVNLAILLGKSGELDQADALYRRALALKPSDPDILDNFAATALARGDGAAALEAISHSLALGQSRRAKKLFVELAEGASWAARHPQIDALMAEALRLPWDRPGRLSTAAARLVKQNPVLAPMVQRAASAWPARLGATELLGDAGFAPLAGDDLLLALLTTAPNTDMALERFLTLVRAVMAKADDAGLSFCAALAQQCFINEYVFAGTTEEMAAAQARRDRLTAALASGSEIAPADLLAVAAYFPLHALAHAGKLLERAWPQSVEAVLTQQLREPLEEQRLAAAIPRRTPIRDAVSRLVRDQYEQNPYPRWVRLEGAGAAIDVADFLSHRYPLAAPHPPGRAMRDILVAGCGTGQQSIHAAQKFGGQGMLAVDLSLASLAYAARKTAERGLGVEYAQADILELADRDFDVIEAIGVLHHMQDPYAGWQALLSRLRPLGFMRLGFYSRLARQGVGLARARIAELGLANTADDIRAFRQQLADGALGDAAGPILRSEDFFAISSCRDLLFHAQEHVLTLPDIAAFLEKHGLHFLGFDLGDASLRAYRRRFPDDAAATDLAAWAVFEQENPDTFAGLYVFWIQKP